jgi:cytochrome b561
VARTRLKNMSWPAQSPEFSVSVRPFHWLTVEIFMIQFQGELLMLLDWRDI